jgi:glycosyltransferase involved in cell wall biosynthesis
VVRLSTAQEVNPQQIDLSFVVIGLNEAAHLPACLASIHVAHLEGLSWEIIYADGGSTDESVEIAQAAGAQILDGPGRRRAATNRNRGAEQARGEFIQFLDGDMILDPQWPRAALDFLRGHPDSAAVCGVLRETRSDLFHRAMQLDWEQPEGEVAFCGGAAMFRASAFRAAGGFPEDVAYGEEPLLCWRLRNDHSLRIHHLHRDMVRHDLAFRGFADYWRRCVRVGEAYGEISARLKHTADPLWRRETRTTLRWAAILLALLVAPLLLPGALAPIPPLLLLGVLARKALQAWRNGQPLPIAVLYALHLYVAKLPTAWGILRATRRKQSPRP